MLRQLFIRSVSLAILLAAFSLSQADEPETLMGRILEWQYPGAQLSEAVMSDAATLDKKGRRTVPSIQCKVVMTTSDSIDTVFEYYRSRLVPKDSADTAEAKDESVTESGRSVTFHHDSENRPVTIHIIAINTDSTSTTLVISRSKAETETHIGWTQYAKFRAN